jgi:hypothetical protein
VAARGGRGVGAGSVGAGDGNGVVAVGFLVEVCRVVAAFLEFVECGRDGVEDTRIVC